MISVIILSVGLALMVMGIRFIMVKNSLKAGKPSDERLKTLKKEWLRLLPGGFIVFLIGFLGPYLQLPIEQAKVVANAGGVLFGLGIPQYLQYKKGQGNEQQINKSLQTIRTCAWVITIVGMVLVIGSPFIPF